jgi:hypothetical protein
MHPSTRCAGWHFSDGATTLSPKGAGLTGDAIEQSRLGSMSENARALVAAREPWFILTIHRDGLGNAPRPPLSWRKKSREVLVFACKLPGDAYRKAGLQSSKRSQQNHQFSDAGFGGSSGQLGTGAGFACVGWAACLRSSARSGSICLSGRKLLLDLVNG